MVKMKCKRITRTVLGVHILYMYNVMHGSVQYCIVYTRFVPSTCVSVYFVCIGRFTLHLKLHVSELEYFRVVTVLVLLLRSNPLFNCSVIVSTSFLMLFPDLFSTLRCYCSEMCTLGNVHCNNYMLYFR